MSRRLTAALVMGVVFALSAGDASACGTHAYMMFGSPLGNTGTPADSPDLQTSFAPGAPVTISGYLFDPAPATPLTLRWGVDGPAIADVTVQPGGTWTTTFTLPADIAPGAYLLSTSALDEEGLPVTIRTTLTVVAPSGPPAEEPVAPVVPVPEEPAVVQPPAAQPRARPAPPRSAAPAPARTPRVTTPRAPVPEVAPAPSVPVAIAAAPAPAPEPAAAPARPEPRVRAASPTQRATPPPPSVRVPEARAVTAPREAAAGDASREWPLLVLVALAALALGGAAGATVLVRRRRTPPAPDPVEAELQELIAEERARRMLDRIER